MKPTVLITGGSGLVGRYLTSLLLSEGFEVSHLSRGPGQFGRVRVFRWDPYKGILDPEILRGVDTIIHLAGANIGEKRWTPGRMNEIIRSRVESAGLIRSVLSECNLKIGSFISSSAIAYYGTASPDKVFTEDDPPSNDFLADTCRMWEEAADSLASLGARVVKIRAGIALEKTDGALAKLMLPARAGFLVSMGSGRQYVPWIHISDLCRIYLKAITDSSMSGAFNAVSSQHTTHAEFMKTLSVVMNKPLLPFAVPSIILKAALGDKSEVVLKGSRISGEKITRSGFSFGFPDLETALRDVLAT